MRILLLRSHAGYYGVERMVVELAAGLQQLGHEPCVGIIGRADESDESFVDACRQRQLAYRLFVSKSPADVETIAAMNEWIKVFKPHVIHSHGYKADVLAWLANRSLQRPLMGTCHPWLGTSDRLRMKCYAVLDKLLLTRFDKVTAISETVKAECALGPFRRRDIQVISNGVDLEEDGRPHDTESLRRRWHLDLQAFIIGVVGRLSVEKGQRLLLPAFADVCRSTARPLMLLLIGDGPDRSCLEEQACKLGLQQRVKFLGYQQEIPALLSCLDLFVMPSLSEGLPLALLEAMAAGRAILATDVGEIGSVLDHGRAGMIVEPNRSDKLAAGMLHLIEQPELCATMARQAQTLAKNNYSRAHMATQYQQAYRTLSHEKELPTHAR